MAFTADLVLRCDIVADLTPSEQPVKTMAAAQKPHDLEAKGDEEYEPDFENLVEERAKNYLEHVDELARAYEIASAIGSTPAYTRERCNALEEDEEIVKEYGSQIIGHPMPPNGESIAVLEGNRDALLGTVDTYGSAGQYQQALQIDSINELREFIKKNIAIGDGHGLGTNKVYFGSRKDREEE